MERLDAPRSWFPRRGLLRVGCVCALLVTAGALLLAGPPGHRTTGSPAAEPAGACPRSGPPEGDRPSCDQPSGDQPSGGALGSDTRAGGTPSGDTPTGNARTDGRPRGGQSSSGSPGGIDLPADVLPSGTVGFPLRLADPAVLAVLRVGQRVDILVPRDVPRDPVAGSSPADGLGSGAVVVAAGLRVLRTVGTADSPDGVLYLAVTPAQAGALAAIGTAARVSVTVRSPD